MQKCPGLNREVDPLYTNDGFSRFQSLSVLIINKFLESCYLKYFYKAIIN